MKPASLLAAVLCSVLAAPAFAQTTRDTAPPKYDFTVRPDLRPYDAAPPRDASKPMTVEEAKILTKNLFSSYANVGGLSVFRFHIRTKDEAPMTAEELAWAEAGLRDHTAYAEKLHAEAQAAIKVGFVREAPLPESMKEWAGKLKRARMAGRAKGVASPKATFETYRRLQYQAVAGISLDLYQIVESDAGRLEEVEPEVLALAHKELATEIKELAEARQNMEKAAKEADAQGKNNQDKLEGARARVARAAAGGPKGGNAAKGAGLVLDDRAKAPGKAGDAGVPDSGSRITPEEAARQANAAEARAANRKKGRSPAIVPPP